MKKIIRTLGLASLLVGASMIVVIPLTNLSGYFDTKERIAKYGSVEKAAEIHEKEMAKLGCLWGKIHSLYFGIGEERAYQQYNPNKKR